MVAVVMPIHVGNFSNMINWWLMILDHICVLPQLPNLFAVDRTTAAGQLLHEYFNFCNGIHVF